MNFELISLVAGTFAGLLPIANPFSAAAVFVGITDRFSEEQAQEQARRACIYMAAILLVSLFAGALIMKFFGISIPALRIAGGLIVARVGFGMLNPEPTPEVGEAHTREALQMPDVAFTPLAMPLLSGPGSIAVTIGMAATAHTLLEYLAVAAGIVLVAIVSRLVFRSARRVIRRLGETGMTALVRVMGFLLVCVGIQFIGLGVVDIVTNEKFLRALLEGLAAARA